MKWLRASRFFELLDDAMCPQKPVQDRCQCWGDFRNSRPILLNRRFKERYIFKILNMVIRYGGFCDCEILYNVLEESRLKEEYWVAKSHGRTPYDPHSEL